MKQGRQELIKHIFVKGVRWSVSNQHTNEQINPVDKSSLNKFISKEFRQWYISCQTHLITWEVLKHGSTGSGLARKGLMRSKHLSWEVCDNQEFCCCSVAQLCPILYDSMDWSTPGFPVHHSFLESARIHVYWVGDVIQPSHPLLPSSLFAFSLSQHQSIFQ